MKEPYKWYETAYMEENNFSETKNIRNLVPGRRFALTGEAFYMWSNDGRIIKCGIDGNLSVLFSVDDIEIKDMMQIRSNLSETEKFIVSKDEQTVIFRDGDNLRIIRKR